jgi:hypothetical protein
MTRESLGSVAAAICCGLLASACGESEGEVASLPPPAPAGETETMPGASASGESRCADGWNNPGNEAGRARVAEALAEGAETHDVLVGFGRDVPAPCALLFADPELGLAVQALERESFTYEFEVALPPVSVEALLLDPSAWNATADERANVELVEP